MSLLVFNSFLVRDFSRSVYDSFTATAFPPCPNTPAVHIGTPAVARCQSQIELVSSTDSKPQTSYLCVSDAACDLSDLAPFLISVCVYIDLQEKADLGELNFSLCYLPTAGRLTATIIKATNLKAMDLTGFSGKELTHSHTSCRCKTSSKHSDWKLI